MLERQVVTIHDAAVFDHPEYFSPKFVAWYRWLIPKLARKVRKIITVSEFAKSRLLEVCKVPPDRIVVIPNGVSGKFQPAEAYVVGDLRKRYQLGEQRYILVVGSLDPRKNLAGVIAAWERSTLVREGFVLAIAGSAANTFRRSSKAQKDPAGVLRLGYVADNDLPALYTGAQQFVFASVYEGFGLPPLEAMSCGTPVVCSNTSSLPEVVGDAALMVAPDDVDAIGHAMRRLVEQGQLLEQLRLSGKRRAALFSWEKAAKATLEVLTNAAGT